jgi:DNA-binding phage protein
MIAITTRGFDVYLDDDEAIADYLTAALQTSDASFIADALGRGTR